MAHTHSACDPRAFFCTTWARLARRTRCEPAYGELPAEDAFEHLIKGRRGVGLEAVGYGRQKFNPVIVQADRLRLKADLMVVNPKGVAGIGNLPDSNSMLLSSDAKHGDTSFGTS